MMAEALDRWLREEMELPPSAAPSPAALRRLCSGPTAPIWDFITRHVRSQRNVKKIRGNLRWFRYGHLQELEAAVGPASRQGALRAAVARRRKELRQLADVIADAQEVMQRLEAELEAGQQRRWAELRRGAELRLLGAEPIPARLGQLGAELHKGAGPRPRPGQSRAELAAILASGAEPEVLVSIKALCKAREAELRKPRPPRRLEEAAPDWLAQAEAVLIGHSPGAVLWALQELANHSIRALLDGPAPSVEAPPTLRELLQERWGALGGLWAALPPLQAHLAGLGSHLGRLRELLGQRGAPRLALTRAGLRGFLSSLSRELQGLQKIPKSLELAPKSPELAPKIPKIPKSPLGRQRRRLRRARGRVLRLQQRLRLLSAASRGRGAGLGALQGQVVGVARAGPGSAPPPLEGEGRRRRELELGTLGAPLPPPAPPPLRGVGVEMGAGQGALLARAAALRHRLRQGALRARRGAGPPPGAGPQPDTPLPAQGGVAELLPQLRLVHGGCQRQLRAWPRLQGLVSQWWTQPAQWALATPPGHAPFSHWLQRWRSAALALQATPTREAGPEEATPP